MYRCVIDAVLLTAVSVTLVCVSVINSVFLSESNLVHINFLREYGTVFFFFRTKSRQPLKVRIPF